MIEIKGTKGRTLLFIANTMREAELISCGLKLLLERETSRVGVRGGIPIQKLSGASPSTVVWKGNNNNHSVTDPFLNTKEEQAPSPVHSTNIDIFPSIGSSAGGDSRSNLGSSNWSSSENDESDGVPDIRVPEGRTSWSQVPTRNHLRKSAQGQHDFLLSQEESIVTPPCILPSPIKSVGAAPLNMNGEKTKPIYSHGELKIADISSDVLIPIPLPLCRALLLDSSSPLMQRWEIDRGDSNYSKTGWNFPPPNPRRSECNLPENQLLSRGSMEGGHRTILYDRLRNGQKIRLSETLVVAVDKNETVTMTIAERMPRRGFSTKARITIDKASKHSCIVSIFGEIVPVGKNLSNQGAVHRAYLLVVDELHARYSTENEGLLAGLISIVRTFPASNTESPMKTPIKMKPSRSPRESAERKKDANTQHCTTEKSISPLSAPKKKRRQPGIQTVDTSRNSSRLEAVDPESSCKSQNHANTFQVQSWADGGFEEWDTPGPDTTEEDDESLGLSTESEEVIPNRTIDVKPLPKLPLELMPAPREEDEEDLSTV